VNAQAQGGSPFGGMTPEEFFANVFGGSPFGGPFGFEGFSPFGGGGGARRRRPTRTPDVQHAVKVDLEDLYTGKTIKVDFNRRVTCTTCKGTTWGVIRVISFLGSLLFFFFLFFQAPVQSHHLNRKLARLVKELVSELALTKWHQECFLNLLKRVMSAEERENQFLPPNDVANVMEPRLFANQLDFLCKSTKECAITKF